MSESYTPTNSVRQDEVFWKTNAAPSMKAWGWNWLCRWYRGTGKIDASQTWRLRSEQIAYAGGYVVASTPKERFSFRLSVKRPDRERWDNWGGI